MYCGLDIKPIAQAITKPTSNRTSPTVMSVFLWVKFMAIFYIKGTAVLVDDEDYALVDKHKWWITPQGYACTKIRDCEGKRRTIGMHRVILGDPNLPAIDHINRNKLDNRKNNLLACSIRQNNRNKPTVSGKASPYRGVSPHRGKWQVVVRINGVLTWIGKYSTQEEANNVASPYFDGIVA